MNRVGFEYEEVDQFYLKDEPETDDAPENRSTLEVQTEKNLTHETRVKCGDVFVGCEGNFTLVCSICRQEYKTFDAFGLHIKERHVGVKSEQELPIELIFTEPLHVPHNKDVRSTSNREKVIKNAWNDDNPIRTPFNPVAESSKSTINSLQTSQRDETTEAKKINDVWEQEEDLYDKSSGDEYIPDEAECNSQTIQVTKEYFCVYCGRTYKSKKRFIAHSKKEHNNDIQAQEAGHTNAPENTIVEPVKMVCKYCDKCFDDQIEFKNHVSTHTGRSRFVCPFCQKTFASRYNRKVHINTHTGERPFKCTHCPKAFSDATNLEMHIRMHLRIMKFSCDYCDKRFVQSTEKKLHERTHTGEKPFQCEECGRRFISHVKLTEHGRRHKNIKNYKCEVCGKAFYSSSLLKDHMPTHTGERPFLCNVCFQTFPRRKSLRAHQQLHSNEKKYVCDTCGKAFAQCAGLYSHRKSHGEKAK